MGQRHQIFVKIANPAKHVWINSTKQKKELAKEFGTGEFTILAYHNQWLYGRSALQSCLNLLNFASQFTREQKTTKEGHGAYNCPFAVNAYRGDWNDPKAIVDAIAFIMNFRAVKTEWLDAGIGSSWYLGKEDENIRENFTMGDNNDGIHIVDMVENKYCFMNIYEQETGRYDVNVLPEKTPCTAKEYVAAYYGETIETTNPYYFGDHDRTKVVMPIAEQQEIVNKQIGINNLASQGFVGFELLTIAEVQKMFKKMELVKKKVVKKKVKKLTK